VFTLVKKCQGRMPIAIKTNHFYPSRYPNAVSRSLMGLPPLPSRTSLKHTTCDQCDLLKAKKFLAGHATSVYITDEGFILPDGQAPWCRGAIIA
jgi:hypothetical protein